MDIFEEYRDDYEAACERGLRFAGESRDYFARRRVEYTRAICRSLREVDTVIDFGCGLGHTTPHLLAAFDGADVIGVDTSAGVVRAAAARYGGARSTFVCGGTAMTEGADLVYCNGVFHHIARSERSAVAGRIRGWLRRGGLFAFWENNPWNPGTRFIMSQIPFDRDAETLRPREASKLLTSSGFQVRSTTFHFFFPSPLRALRGFEPHLRTIPLGGQYCVLAQRLDD